MIEQLKLKRWESIKNPSHQYLIVTVCAFFATLAVFMTTDEEPFLQSFHGNNMLCIPICFLFIYWINFAFSIHNRRVSKYARVCAISIALIEIIGYPLYKYARLGPLFSSTGQILKNLIRFTGLSILLYCCFVLLFSFFREKQSTQIRKNRFLFGTPKRTFLFSWGIIFTAWMPYFLAVFPGVMSADSIYQFIQAKSDLPLSMSHPVTHTMLIRFCTSIGDYFQNDKLSVAIYAVSQMLFMSAVFAFAISYTSRRKIHKYFQLGLLLLFALFPLHAQYGMIMWKDPAFSASLLLFTLMIIELFHRKEPVKQDRRFLLCCIIVSVSVCLLRNNGLYIYLLTMPFLLLGFKHHRKFLLTVGIPSLIAVFLMNTFYAQVLHAEKGPSKEALSIPMQQLARTEKYHREELTKDEKDFLHQVFDTENIGDYYVSHISDRVKEHFNSEYFNQNKGEFILSWGKMFFRFPKEYIQSFLCGCYGYWYPETVYWTGFLMIEPNQYGILQTPVLPQLQPLFNKLELFNPRAIPVVSMLYSIGFAFLTFCITFAVALFKRQKKFLLAFLPIFFLWLTVVASPVYAEFRYIYGLFITLPVLIPFVVQLPKQEKAGKAGKEVPENI